MIVKGLFLSSLLAATNAESQEGITAGVAKSLYQNEASFYHQRVRRKMTQLDNLLPEFLHTMGSVRRLDDKSNQASCDAAFLSCLPDLNCVDCFATLELEAIDWTGVTPDTECSDVVNFLTDGGHCKKLLGEDDSTETFCQTFNACVVWENVADDDAAADDMVFDDDDWVNCTALTECKWPGMKQNWIGDGICHDNIHGCYNTAICNYDGGDCCKDTCVDGDEDYKECGHDGYACRDPASAECDSDLTESCPQRGGKDDSEPSSVSCKGDDEQKYKLVMYDSFGDGWDATTLTISSGGKKPEFEGSLKDGSEGTEYVCLSKEPTCYTAETKGGSWGVEVSWELKPMKEGAPALAGGGAPNKCDFPVAGADCEKTCDGRPNVDPNDDPDYKEFKDLYNCIEDQCIIQLGACQKDEVCEQCFAEEAPEYCFGVDSFLAVIDCTMCSCTDKKDSEFCESKPGPGGSEEQDKEKDDNAKPQKCTPQETMAGAKAVMDFAKCSDVDEIAEMVTEFDQNNFGQLDAFEACAHSYNNDENNGGHTALGCMQILYNAMTNPTVKDNSDAPKEAIAALAKNLYEDSESFCQCAKVASEQCPLCPSFNSFKTLLYESIDACKALDEIECDAWGEFHAPCKTKLEEEFGKSDFKTKQQCEFVKEKNCGGAGPFPAYRKLECSKDLEKDAWDFYKSYSRECLAGDDGKPPDAPVAKPTRAPVTKPTRAPTADNKPRPTAKPYVPSDGTAKPYVPSDSNESSSDTKKKSHWFRNFVILSMIAGGGYYVYKQRYDSFNFVQYRRTNGFGNFGNLGNFGNFSNPFSRGGNRGYENYDQGGMYTNLNNSTTFEPPSLPPTPMMMGTEMT